MEPKQFGASALPPGFAPYPYTPRRYSGAPPQLVCGADPARHPVVVVGAGPVGLCAALGLACHGIRTVLIEADDSVCTGSRAICISRRSLEILARLGALDGFLRIGLPWSTGRSFYRDREVLRFSMPHDENQRLPPMLNLAQYHIEQILLDRAGELGDLIDLRWETRLAALEPRDDGVRLALKTPRGDYHLEADWVVAADGGRSTVRAALGLGLTGTAYEGRYVIVDIRLRSDRPTERLAFFDAPCNPGSTVLVHKQPDDVWRIDYQLRDDEDPEAAVLPENVIPRVRSLLSMIGERGDWSPIWISLYRANALTLDRYRHGRVLFAGDAAHLVPIFGVRGANSGIDDADNLAWKLAAVVQGTATDALLDSYSDERVAAARENLRYGAKSTEFMAPPAAAFALMRTAVLGLAVRHPALRSLINPRQTSAISYTESPLSETQDHSSRFAGGPPPGAVLLECPIMIAGESAGKPARAGFLTELLGARFTILDFEPSADIPSDFASLADSFADRGIRVRVIPLVREPSADAAGCYAWDHTGRLFAIYDAAPRAVYLIRPDGHVLARWRGVPAADVAATLDRVLGRSAPRGATR